MKNPFKNIFTSQSHSVPEKVKKHLYHFFPGAVNVEWGKNGEDYEAIFYMDEMEHIVKITAKDGVCQIKKNLKFADLMKKIRDMAATYGEVMNVISIFSDRKITYEIIVRDENLKRSMVLLNSEGQLLSLKPL